MRSERRVARGWMARVLVVMAMVGAGAVMVRGEGKGEEAGGDPPAVEIAVPDKVPYREQRYVMTAEETERVRGLVRDWAGRRVAVSPETETYYSDDITWLDGWLVQPGTPLAEPPAVQDDDATSYQWTYVRGRVAKVCRVQGGKESPEVEVRSNSIGAPVLTISGSGETAIWNWADYDGEGMLRRVVRMGGEDMRVLNVSVFDNTKGYETTVHREFTPDGRLYGRSRYEDDQVLVTDMASGMERVVNAGSRRWWVSRMCQYGLATSYPMGAREVAK